MIMNSNKISKRREVSGGLKSSVVLEIIARSRVWQPPNGIAMGIGHVGGRVALGNERVPSTTMQ